MIFLLYGTELHFNIRSFLNFAGKLKWVYSCFGALMPIKWQFSRKIILKISTIKIKITTLYGRKSFNDSDFL